ERSETSTALANFVEHVEQVPRRARQAVQPRYDQHVAGFQPTDCLGQLGPIRLGPGELFLEHFGTASGHELGVLRGQVLIAGRNPCISVCRHFPLQIWRTFAPIFAGINDREIAGGCRCCGCATRAADRDRHRAQRNRQLAPMLCAQAGSCLDRLREVCPYMGFPPVGLSYWYVEDTEAAGGLETSARETDVEVS